MKKTGLIFLLSVLLFSCQQIELQFSCDPIIDAYVTENREELAQLTISELIVYEIPLQRAVFSSWSAEKKRDAWLNKLYYVLENETFSEVEALHVQNLIEHIHPYYFNKEIIQQEFESRLQYEDEWIAFASDSLDWSVEYIAFMVYRLYENYSQMEAEISMINALNEEVSSDSEGFNCDCSISSDYCHYSICILTGCDGTSDGCGLLWGFPCDGNCS